jgi:hypothetical protein
MSRVKQLHHPVGMDDVGVPIPVILSRPIVMSIGK